MTGRGTTGSFRQSADLHVPIGLAGTRTGIVTPSPHDGASGGIMHPMRAR
jgi:hypothetical protein